MICLADNDIILKLACCDLLSEAVAALGVSLGDVLVLNSAIHKLLGPKKPGKGRVKQGEPEYERLRAFFDSIRVIDIAPPSDELDAFNDVLGIDTGEAVLFSATGFYADCLLATSDKRSLIALCGAGGRSVPTSPRPTEGSGRLLRAKHPAHPRSSWVRSASCESCPKPPLRRSLACRIRFRPVRDGNGSPRGLVELHRRSPAAYHGPTRTLIFHLVCSKNGLKREERIMVVVNT